MDWVCTWPTITCLCLPVWHKNRILKMKKQKRPLQECSWGLQESFDNPVTFDQSPCLSEVHTDDLQSHTITSTTTYDKHLYHFSSQLLSMIRQSRRAKSHASHTRCTDFPLTHALPTAKILSHTFYFLWSSEILISCFWRKTLKLLPTDVRF